MALFTYNYSISTDFHGAINSDNLTKEINSVELSSVLESITTDDDNVFIVFYTVLSAGDKTTLDTVVANHNGSIPTDNSIINPIHLTLNSAENNTSIYSKIAVFVYDPTIFKNIKKIEIVSHIDPNDSSYDIRVYDTTNRQTIVENTFYNYVETIDDLGSLSNIPTNKSLIEIQSRVSETTSNNNNLHVSAIIFYII